MRPQGLRFARGQIRQCEAQQACRVESTTKTALPKTAIGETRPFFVMAAAAFGQGPSRSSAADADRHQPLVAVAQHGQLVVNGHRRPPIPSVDALDPGSKGLAMSPRASGSSRKTWPLTHAVSSPPAKRPAPPPFPADSAASEIACLALSDHKSRFASCRAPLVMANISPGSGSSEQSGFINRLESIARTGSQGLSERLQCRPAARGTCLRFAVTAMSLPDTGPSIGSLTNGAASQVCQTASFFFEVEGRDGHAGHAGLLQHLEHRAAVDQRGLNEFHAQVADRLRHDRCSSASDGIARQLPVGHPELLPPEMA